MGGNFRKVELAGTFGVEMGGNFQGDQWVGTLSRAVKWVGTFWQIYTSHTLTVSNAIKPPTQYNFNPS